MTFGQVLEYGVRRLTDAGIDDAQPDAFYLLAHLTGFSKADYYLKKNEETDAAMVRAYHLLLDRRALHEPCQYIIGDTEFMGLSFQVDDRVLIPRQDTETLAEAALEAIRQLEKTASSRQGNNTPVRVLDLCTGSGALAVSIKHYCPETEVVASDISDAALAVAKENAQINHSEITFVQSDLFADLKGGHFDVIVSNPPYVTDEEYGSLMPEVRLHEPEGALRAGPDGLDYYRRIAKEAGRYLFPDGRLLLEIGCAQAAAVGKLLSENSFSDIRIRQDLNGLDRVAESRMARKTGRTGAGIQD